MAASVREYAILYIGARRASGGGSSIGGGNIVLNSPQHAHDGPEHSGQLPHSKLAGLLADDHPQYAHREETPLEHGDMGASDTIDVGARTWHRGNLNVACAITVAGYVTAEGLIALLEFTGTGAIAWDPDVDFGGADDQPNASGYTAFVLWSSEGDSDIKAARVGGSSAISVTDGSTTVDPATSLAFNGATVSEVTPGVAQVDIITPPLANVLDAGNDADGIAIANLADPTDPQDAATKAYVDGHTSTGLLTVDPGTPTYDDSGPDVVVTYASKWGVDMDGPYFNDAGVSAGDEAILALDPTTGELAVVPYHP